jgi:hypothetical protein
MSTFIFKKQKEARDKGFEQVLWLYGPEGLCTQLGDMNIFVDLVDRNGGKDLDSLTYLLLKLNRAAVNHCLAPIWWLNQSVSC